MSIRNNAPSESFTPPAGATVRMAARMTVCISAIAFTLACDRGDESGGAAVRAQRTVQGDTTVVRTLSGSAWGDTATLQPQFTIGVLDGDERYMFGDVAALAVTDNGRVLVTDAQALTVRVFDSAGVFVGSWGRDGAGPGEFRSLDAGLAVLADGRVVVRDPGNARLQIFSAEGEPLTTWGVISGQWRSREPLFVTADTLLTLQPAGDVSDISNVSTALVRITAQGRVADTIAIPAIAARAAQVTARRGGNAASLPVP